MMYLKWWTTDFVVYNEKLLKKEWKLFEGLLFSLKYFIERSFKIQNTFHKE